MLHKQQLLLYFAVFTVFNFVRTVGHIAESVGLFFFEFFLSTAFSLLVLGTLYALYLIVER